LALSLSQNSRIAHTGIAILELPILFRELDNSRIINFHNRIAYFRIVNAAAE
jgi:hypothetical protein